MRVFVTRLGVLLACLIAGLSITSAARADAGAPRPTREVVVRPVNSDGDAAPGWRVRHVRGRATCDEASPVALDDGIAACSPSALYLPSCWQQGGIVDTLLCLRAPSGRQLVQVRLAGDYPSVRAPRRAAPLELVLRNGETCRIRVGGAWGTVPGHPRWVGFYSCDQGDVYGPPRGGGIDRSRPEWRVQVLQSDGTVVTRMVRRATYVGTSAAPTRKVMPE